LDGRDDMVGGFAVSAALVGCMGVNAFEGLLQGKAPSETRTALGAAERGR